MSTQSAIRHYDSDYFKWQGRYGSLSALANYFKFSPYLKPSDAVLDFGCGGGFLLEMITAKKKIGVEVNPVAQTEASRRGLTVCDSMADVESASIDIIISNHALEHVEDPMFIIREFRRALKPGGLAVIVTPYDRPSYAFDINDRDFHLFGWSPSNLGNLVRNAGFDVLDARELKHAWPPKWNLILEHFGSAVFHAICRIYSRLGRARTQIRVVARRHN